MAASSTWLKVCGESDQSLASELEGRVRQKIENKEFSADNVYYVSKVDLRPVKNSLDLSDIELEKLRAMCSLWSLELRPVTITSHRRFIGPLIVAAKKIAFPIIRIFMRDVLRQQSSFNAATIAMVTEIANRRHNSNTDIAQH